MYPVRTQSSSRPYAIIISYVRNVSRTYAIIISYVRNHDLVRTQSWSRTYAIMISYVRNHDLVRTQSLSRTYAIIFPYVYVMIKYDRAILRFPHPPFPSHKQIRFRLPLCSGYPESETSFKLPHLVQITPSILPANFQW